MFTHVLVPLDGSKLAEKALPVAQALAEKFESQLTLVRAIPDAPGHTKGGDPSAHDQLFDQMREQLSATVEEEMEAYVDVLTAQGLEASYQLAVGVSPLEGILQTAQETGADAIVMSTHGRVGMSRWLFGSVADEVLRQANIPVVIIRGEDDD
ncbi:MAG: universal stress protein [Anaerolineales bacterium]|nr:universal stress protein [Anaerolineales bacterium]